MTILDRLRCYKRDICPKCRNHLTKKSGNKMPNKTEVLVHKGKDCSLWELVKETDKHGQETRFLRCMASGDKVAIAVIIQMPDSVHWESEELQLEHGDKED